MNRLPFRRRLTVWSTMVAAVSILICGAGASWFIHHWAVAEIDAELRAESEHFFAELQNHGGSGFDWRKIDNEMREWLPLRNPPRYIEVRTGPEVRWRSQNLGTPGFTSYGIGRRNVNIGDAGVRLLIREQGGVIFAIGANLSQAGAVAGALVLALLAGLPLALAFAWFGGRRIADLAVGPLERMANAAERVSAEHLDQRVPVPGAADEIQRLAKVLNATFDRLERSYQQAVRFSGDASHELKTPLTVLRTSIEAVLESPTLCEAERAAISGLLEQTHRLTNITSSLLLLARADAGRLTLDLEERDLAALTEACVEDARIVAEQRGVRVECAMPETAPARVDPLRFAQIVSNLLDNAVKYNHCGGEVRVGLSADKNMWVISISNTGPGIAEEHRSRLFERFFRAEHTAEENGQGLGLGLARELARAHGGDVSLVRSEEGWTEFAATFPMTTVSSNDPGGHRQRFARV